MIENSEFRLADHEIHKKLREKLNRFSIEPPFNLQEGEMFKEYKDLVKDKKELNSMK